MTAELRHLRAFLAIADAGTITAAATRLHMPVPVSLAWTDPPSHPAVEPLVRLAREVVPGQPPAEDAGSSRCP